MSQIDEWTPLFPRKNEVAKEPAPGEIYRRLTEIDSGRPVAVHFYLGEGLRWIRVGFGEEEPLRPSAVVDVGRAIERCLRTGPLYFHALRPYDMLFFLDGGDPDSTGMPAEYYGAPLVDVLRSWGLEPSPAPIKTKAPLSRAAAGQLPVAGKRKKASVQVRQRRAGS